MLSSSQMNALSVGASTVPAYATSVCDVLRKQIQTCLHEQISHCVPFEFAKRYRRV